MTLTVWEKSVLHSVVGASKHAHISEIEALLALRKSLEPSKEDKDLIKNSLDKSFTTDSDVVIGPENAKILYKTVMDKAVNLPVRKESVELRKKLQSKLREDSNGTE